MPPKKSRCEAQILVTSPSLPASTSSPTIPTSNPTSPGGTPILINLPATQASISSTRCPNPALNAIVGSCAFCGKKFCGTHKQLEMHHCTGLQQCKDEAHAANKAKLESEKTIAKKIAST